LDEREQVMTEKRACPRIKSFHPVLYRKDVYPKETLASTMNLSTDGVKIKSLYSLTKGESLDVAISFAADSRVIKCRGKVKYVLGPENGKVTAGIQFEELSEHDRLFLWQFLYYLKESVPITLKLTS
jgi:hypothetical protein